MNEHSERLIGSLMAWICLALSFSNLLAAVQILAALGSVTVSAITVYSWMKRKKQKVTTRIEDLD